MRSKAPILDCATADLVARLADHREDFTLHDLYALENAARERRDFEHARVVRDYEMVQYRMRVLRGNRP